SLGAGEKAAADQMVLMMVAANYQTMSAELLEGQASRQPMGFPAQAQPTTSGHRRQRSFCLRLLNWRGPTPLLHISVRLGLGLKHALQDLVAAFGVAFRRIILRSLHHDQTPSSP